MNSMKGKPMRMRGKAMMADKGRISRAGRSKKCDSVSGCSNSASMSRCLAGGMRRLRAMSSRVCEKDATWCPESTICRTTVRYSETSCPTPTQNCQASRIGRARSRGRARIPAPHSNSCSSVATDLPRACHSAGVVENSGSFRPQTQCSNTFGGASVHGPNCRDRWDG